MEEKIQSSGKISTRFIQEGILNFSEAAQWVKNLPYKRNINKSDLLCLFLDEGGTCSTKHALLKRLAEENNLEVKLMLGIFKINPQNTPKISAVLQRYHLKEMPEAHNYLKIKNEIFDFTSRNSQPEDFINDLITEIEILPEQITNFKVQYHQNFLRNYLIIHPEIPYSQEQFWQIREECITALQQ